MSEPLKAAPPAPAQAGQHTARFQNLALAGAGPALTICAGVLVWIVWKGDWPADLAKARLSYLGISLWILLALLAFVIVASTAGLVKGLDVSLGAMKARIDLDDDNRGPGDEPHRGD